MSSHPAVPPDVRRTDGPAGAIYRLWPAHRGAIRDHLLRLDHAERMLRFAGHVGDEAIVTYCDRLVWSRALIVGYVIGGTIRGVGELTPLNSRWPRSAEIALSVERPHQNRGVGSALIRRLFVGARNRMIRRIHMICAIDNTGAMRLARRLDGLIELHAGEAEARIETPWPTWWTWLEESQLAIATRPR